MTELNDFLQKSGPNSHVFVLFYADWCGFCREAKPVWQQIQPLYEHHPSIRIFMVKKEEAEKYSKFRLQGKGIPTFSYFRNGKYVEDYSGERTVDAFQQWIHKHAQRVNQKRKHTIKNKNKKKVGTRRRRRHTRRHG